MTKFTIKNLTIQFDDYDIGADKHSALDMLDRINEVLQENFRDFSPAIITTTIVDDDITIEG